MRFYISAEGEYFCRDAADPGDVEVPERPSALHDWDGARWVINDSRIKAAVLAQIDALQQRAFLNRGSCELEIVTMQDLARRKVNAYLEANPGDTTPAADLILHELETTPYWIQLIALNEQLSALRAQL